MSFVSSTSVVSVTGSATVGLSAGPVQWNATTFLAAAHVSKGGWKDAYRMTVFYLFDTAPPFQVRCSTPPISFGYSKTLEYCTSLQLIDRELYVGFGYNNCHSALVRVSAADIVARCAASREKRGSKQGGGTHTGTHKLPRRPPYPSY